MDGGPHVQLDLRSGDVGQEVRHTVAKVLVAVAEQVECHWLDVRDAKRRSVPHGQARADTEARHGWFVVITV